MRREHTHARAAAVERNAIGSIKLRLRKAEAAERGEEEDNIDYLGGANEKGEGGGMNAMKFNSSDVPTARTRSHRTAERTVTRKLAAQGGREGRDSGRGGREGKDSD